MNRPPKKDSYEGLPGIENYSITPRNPGFMTPILTMLEKSTRDYITEGIKFIEPDKKSRYGLNVPRIIYTLGDMKSHARNMLKIIHRILRSAVNRGIGYRSMKKNPNTPATIADESLINELKTLARNLGCENVGFTQVPQGFIFSNKTILYANAIVLTMEMKKDKIGQAPSLAAGKEVWRTYDRLGIVTNKIAKYLRKHGFGAQAGAALGGDTNYPLLAMKAGLGYIGKHGLLISPGVGPSQRIAAVYTSITNLPITNENSHKWIADFCGGCNACVRACPGGAIWETKPIMEDGNPKHIDYIKLY